MEDNCLTGGKYTHKAHKVNWVPNIYETGAAICIKCGAMATAPNFNRIRNLEGECPKKPTERGARMINKAARLEPLLRALGLGATRGARAGDRRRLVGKAGKRLADSEGGQTAAAGPSGEEKGGATPRAGAVVGHMARLDG